MDITVPIPDDLFIKLVRYDQLQDRYLTQNKKHFEEMCGTYFDDYPMDKLDGVKYTKGEDKVWY